MKRVHLLFLWPVFLALASCSRDPKVVRQKYVDNGNKYFDKGKYREASIMYRRALQKDQRFGEAWYRLGLTNLKLGVYGEARKAFNNARQLDPSNTDAFVKLADIDLAAYLVDPRGNKLAMTEVKEVTDALLSKDPKSYDGMRLSGYVALTQKDLKGAIDKFERANRAKPGQPDLMLSLVNALFLDNQPEQAEKYGYELIAAHKNYGPAYDALYGYYVRSNHPDKGEELLKTKIANNPGQGSYLVQLAFHYYISKRPAEMAATITRLTSDPKTFPNGHMLAGDMYFQIRDFNNAIAQYDQGQKDDPKQKSAYEKRMVEALAVQGKNDQAAKLVSALLKENSKDPEAIAMHAALLLQTGDKTQIKTVIGELQPLVTKMPSSPILHFNLGRAYMASGESQNLEQARLQFQETLKYRKDYVPAKMALAQLELSRGDNAKSVQMAEEILGADPNNLTAMLIRTMGLMNMGEPEKAREYLDHVIQAYPRSNDARYQLGLLDLRSRRFKEAEAAFDSLWKAQDPRGLIGVVETKVAQGQFAEGIKILQDQLQQTPDRSDYVMALANIEFRAGKFGEAAANFQKLVDKDPKAAEMYLRLGEAKRMAGDSKGAITAFETAHTLSPNDPLPTLQLGMLYDVNGNNEAARKAYEDVLKVQPDNPAALNNLAYAKADAGTDLDQALTYAQRAQQKRPGDFDVMDTLGLIYVKKNLTDDGLRVLRELVSRSPERATYRLHLAMALYQKGDKSAARKELEAANRFRPSEREQSRIQELMAKVQ